MNEEEEKRLSNTLAELAKCEQAMGDAEKDVEIYRIKKTQNIYAQRREITKAVPKFWYIVLAENDSFGEYIRVEDFKYLECITDIYVHYDVAEDSDEARYRDFSISFTFSDESGLVPSQVVTKKFKVDVVDGEEDLTSEPVDVQWPEELLDICPSKVKEQKKGETFSASEKKRYRQGMKTLFAWFDWTGKRPAKEFKGGDELTRLIVEDLFPNSVKYYVEAINNDQESEVSSSEGEELDVSDDEEQEDEPQKKKQKV
ncbi:hypothetical protein PUMCH_003261 [Australozyma saopauloensis]|uniref:Vacuolar protein sorting-associated protein 75 n=1 Tax=Australozyma saopauloensis TaxID=291208 RepID=A0AAX4HBW6_9ASCO|nr:hypothetical protein PUMCH_003261 [[Candida] saopauloensis]